MSFKRKNDLVDKAKEILNDEKLNNETKNVLRELVREYEYCTYKEWKDRQEFSANFISGMVNDCGFDEDFVAEKMSNDHPTLQQNFTRFVFRFIKKMANKTYFDDRNKRSVELCKEVITKVEDDHLPYI